ncbi:hypothetical protein D050_4880B, partial [Vibrio parahaemolyticus VPCR-2009]
STC